MLEGWPAVPCRGDMERMRGDMPRVAIVFLTSTASDGEEHVDRLCKDRPQRPCLIVAVAGCGSNMQERAASGALIGAGAGAVMGGSLGSAALGGLAGAGVGVVVNEVQKDKNKKKRKP